MNRFLEYKEALYTELSNFHTWNDETKQEMLNILKGRNIKTVDGMMKYLFDYAFKCGIKRSLELIEKGRYQDSDEVTGKK